MVQNEEMARRKPGWVHEITRLVLGTPSRRKDLVSLATGDGGGASAD